mmetsp:Transcript_449/g.973  ORF Transcript_449/g.973 Transcript_449/m.973 type:complete len:326 (+) Transcript_449:2057-3034(+)
MSAFDSALRYFLNGILWMPAEERWSTNYAESLALHVSAAETACLLENLGVVTKLTEEVAANVTSDKDKIACLFCLTKSLYSCGNIFDSKRVAFAILEQLKEALPRDVGDPSLARDLKDMVATLHSTADETIMGMRPSHTAQQDTLLLSVYSFLTYIMLECNPQQNPHITLRMIQITLNNGLSAISPLALALFAGTLAGMNQNSLAYRISKLAKRLLSTRQSQRFSSYITLVTAACVDWMVEPLQCVAESLLNGHKNGLQVGDIMSARTNYRHYIVNAYLGGQELSLCREQLVDSAELSKQNNLYGFLHEVLCYRMSVSLRRNRFC